MASRPRQEQAHFQVIQGFQAVWSEATKSKGVAAYRYAFLFAFQGERHHLHVQFTYTFNSATPAFSIGKLTGIIQAGANFLALASNCAAQQ